VNPDDLMLAVLVVAVLALVVVVIWGR